MFLSSSNQNGLMGLYVSGLVKCLTSIRGMGNLIHLKFVVMSSMGLQIYFMSCIDDVEVAKDLHHRLVGLPFGRTKSVYSQQFSASTLS